MKGRRASPAGAIAAAFAILAAAAVFAVLVGSVPLSFEALRRGDPVARAILSLRLPRVALAAGTGAALAIAGAALQALLKNPLADPFLLGTSGGAAAGAAVAVYFGASALASPAGAFAGAAAATAAVLLLSLRSGRLDLQRLLLAGVTANAFFSAVILLLFSSSAGGRSRSMLFWMMGSLAEARPSEAAALGLYLAVGGGLLLATAPSLNLFLVGEESAASLGVAVDRTKALVFAAAALLAAAATSFVGIVGFVGLIAPHLARLAWGNDQRRLLPCSAAAGGALVVLADALSRLLFSPAEIPIGAVTALVGVPFFLLALRRVS
ncbi:MAG TPA: iron ABC transporter permease [Thermoanaerobaculia bacterium]|jgi:iron complex transport system permease protein|nr:iron ABC transporter permease [Thermoanaerobaculia bacterium]